MVARKLSRFGLGALSAVALGLVTLSAAPAEADSFAFGYSSGGYYPRHYHRHYHGPAVGYVYVAPPPVYYYPPPPRVVYVNPPPAPVVYQAPQTLPGGPLPAAQPQCREYQSTAVVNNQQVASYGTACLQPDGSWQIVR